MTETRDLPFQENNILQQEKLNLDVGGEKAKIIFMLPGQRFTAGCMKSLLLTALSFQHSGYPFVYINAGFADLYLTRNTLVSNELRNYDPRQVVPVMPAFPDYTHLMWIDSDMVWEPKMIEKLVQDNKDIVGGLCPINWQGKSNAMWVAENGTYFYNMRKQGQKREGLMRVDYTGFAFLLVKRGVFESMRYPWFDLRTANYEDGTYGLISEDIAWCNRATEKGYKIYIDRAVRPGHEKQHMMRF